MIVINLLPEELRPIKRTPLPHLLSLLVLVVAIGVMGVLFVAKLGQISDKRAETAAAEKQLGELQSYVDEYKELEASKARLEDKVNVIQEIISDRIIWSLQLHELSDLTPENFWYERIRVTSKSIRREKMQVDPATGAPVIDKRTKKPVYRMENIRIPIFEISGYIRPDENGSKLVTPLSNATQTDPEFSSVFTLEDPVFYDTEYDGLTVKYFVLQFTIETGEES